MGDLKSQPDLQPKAHCRTAKFNSTGKKFCGQNFQEETMVAKADDDSSIVPCDQQQCADRFENRQY
eukprot:jgi/Botrbrau1/5808/Bobra.0155s0030.1